jgi:hypothetical protein
MLADFAGNAGLAKAVDHVSDEYREIGDYRRMEDYFKAIENYEIVAEHWPELANKWNDH